MTDDGGYIGVSEGASLIIAQGATCNFIGSGCFLSGAGTFTVKGTMFMNTPSTLTPAIFYLSDGGRLEMQDGILAAHGFYWFGGTTIVQPVGGTGSIQVNAGDTMEISGEVNLDKMNIIGAGRLTVNMGARVIARNGGTVNVGGRVLP